MKRPDRRRSARAQARHTRGNTVASKRKSSTRAHALRAAIDETRAEVWTPGPPLPACPLCNGEGSDRATREGPPAKEPLAMHLRAIAGELARAASRAGELRRDDLDLARELVRLWQSRGSQPESFAARVLEAVARVARWEHRPQRILVARHEAPALCNYARALGLHPIDDTAIKHLQRCALEWRTVARTGTTRGGPGRGWTSHANDLLRALGANPLAPEHLRNMRRRTT